MIYLAITMDDCTNDRWSYRVQYMDRITRVDLPIPFEAMAVLERQKALGMMLSEVFEQEQLHKLNERPGETPEAELLDELLDGEEEEDDPEKSP